MVHHAKRAALLAYLAAALPRGPHRRDKLLALFWPDSDEQRARAALSQAVYFLRERLGEDAITPRGDAAVGIADVVWCDAAAFESALDTGKAAEALALYRGDLLDGFYISDAPEFERWLDGERARLRERACAGAWALAEQKAAEGDVFEAARWARWAVERAPADEAVIRRLMTFFRGLGDRAAAIRAYEAFAERLKQDFDLEPSPETRALAASMRQEAPRAPVVRSGEPVTDAPSAGMVAMASRRRPGWATASIVGVAMLAMIGWMWLRSREPPRQPLVRFTLEFLAGQTMMSAVPGTTIALSPEGTHLAYLGVGPQGVQLYLRSMNRVAAVPIPHTRGAQQPFFSPDGAWLGFVVGNTIRKVPLASGPSITVCRAEGTVLGVSWGPNENIVFARPDGLWLVPASGGDARLISASDTAGGEWYRWPELLPAGRAAVFTRVDHGGFQLAAVSIETGTVHPLGLEGTSPHYVPPGYLLFTRADGALLAAPFDADRLRVTGPAFPVIEGVQVGIAGASKLGVSRTGIVAYVTRSPRDRTLVIVDRAGNPEEVGLPARGYGVARFSPDGGRIATTVLPADGNHPDIWVLDRGTGTFRRLTFDRGSLDPLWTPDGRRIAFATMPGGRLSGWSIRWIAADGTDSAVSLLPSQLERLPTAFTPDGGTLVLHVRQPLSGWDIWSIPMHGDRRLQPLLRGPSDEHSALVSPDGRWLAYVSNEAGQDEVYVRPFPRPGGPVQVSTAGGREPRWAPSGRELFYRDQRGLVAAAVTASPSFRVGQRRVLFDDTPYLSHQYSAAYDVHPDGRRFLMVRRGSESPQVVVVLNWLEQHRAIGDVVGGTESPR